MLATELSAVLDHCPSALAVVQGNAHAIRYANAAFRAIPGLNGSFSEGRSIGDLFGPSIAPRLSLLIDRVIEDGHALCDQFLGPVDAAGQSWMATLWLLRAREDAPRCVVVEMDPATRALATDALQREVAERLLLSALRESDAAEGAQASRKRAMFLAAAGRSLAESLDLDVTMKTVAELTLPALAEWCIVDLVDDDASVHRLSIIHGDPDKQAIVNQLQTYWTPQPGDRFGVPAVLAGQRSMVTDNPNATVAATVQDPEILRLLRELGTGPLLSVPLLGERGVLGAITFVSEQGGFTEEDIQLAEDLADRSALALENARLYAHAMVLRRKAEAIARNATGYLGTVSHELRTPLNTIFGYVQLMASGMHGIVSEQQRVDLDRISMSQRHLMVIIEELLNVIRFENEPVAYESTSVPLEAAAVHAVDFLEPLFLGKRITCTVVPDPSRSIAWADPDRVHQILVNLIANATKFTGAGGEITVTCRAEGPAVVEVSDNGRGIPADKLELIFEPYMQAQVEDAKLHGGVGLGLSISRSLARGMHGDLRASSTLGEGSTFTLTLPLQLTS